MNEFEQLRDFRKQLDTPPPGALARARVRALTDDRHSAAPRWSSRLALPSIGVAVVAVVVGAGIVFRPGGPAPAPPQFGATSAAGPTTPAPPSAAQIVESLAAVAEAGPAAPSVSNKLIKVTSRYWNGQRWVPESYQIEPYGLIMFHNEQYGDPASFQAWVAQQRAQLEADGPTIRQPTPEWLASLDVSPTHLRQLFAAFVACRPGGCVAGDEEWSIWNDIADLTRKGDVMLPPQVRGGLLRVLATFPNLTAEQFTYEGKRYWAVGFPHAMERAEFYIDPETGHIVGKGSVELARASDPDACSKALAKNFGKSPTPGPTPPALPTACAPVTVAPQSQKRLPDMFWSTTLIAAP